MWNLPVYASNPCFQEHFYNVYTSIFQRSPLHSYSTSHGGHNLNPASSTQQCRHTRYVCHPQNLPYTLPDTNTSLVPRRIQLTSPLLRLPAELRNSIYRIACTDLTIAVKHHQKRTPSNSPPTALALLFTCKQLRFETKFLLSTHATISLGQVLDLSQILPYSSLCRSPRLDLSTRLPQPKPLSECRTCFHQRRRCRSTHAMIVPPHINSLHLFSAYPPN
jgi:hypothetical protein